MGLISKLFAKAVSSKLKDNPDVQNAISKTERDLEKARKEIEETAGDKETVKKALHPDVRKALGFDY